LTPSSSQTQQITTFADDSSLASYKKPLMTTDSDWLSIAHDSPVHTIHDVLQRPVLIHQGEFTTTFAPIQFVFPNAIFEDSKNVISKLDYFTYFRANICVRILINATPFMSGRYWFFFAPYNSKCGRPAQAKGIAGQTDTVLANCTGYPGVEIDLASNSPVEIEVPYCSPLSHYNLVNSFATMGECILLPINSIQDGTSTIPAGSGATFSVYAWFKDIHLSMPTSAKTRVPITAVAQVATEEEATSDKPISTVADSVASTASSLGNLPVIGPAAKAISWAARAISGGASAVGFSKPISLDPISTLANTPAKGYSHAVGVDSSVKLCSMPDNGLPSRSGLFSSGVDEMDINYIASKSCLVVSPIPWKDTEAPLARLYFGAVAPGICPKVNTSDVRGVLNTTTLGYLSSMFRYWKGGLKYRITCSKTAFHSGRIRVIFHAGVDDITYVSDVSNAYNWILDLSVSSELEFTIPYVANVPWRKVALGAYDSSAFGPEDTKTGILEIQVLTQLRRASTSVADNCPLNLWISGAPDFALSVPDSGRFIPMTPYVTPPTPPPTVRAQVFNDTEVSIDHREQETDTSVKFFPCPPTSLVGHHELSIGEKISNLRQVSRRFSPIASLPPYGNNPAKDGLPAYPYIGPVTAVNLTAVKDYVEIDPAYTGQLCPSITQEPLTEYCIMPSARTNVGVQVKDYLIMKNYNTCPSYYISHLFRFKRGAMRYKVMSRLNNTVDTRSSGWRAAIATTSSDDSLYTQAFDSFNLSKGTNEQPLVGFLASRITSNGTYSQPITGSYGVNDNARLPTFEHVVYGNLNGVLEVEVPHSCSLPITVVGSGAISNDDGPLTERRKLIIANSFDGDSRFLPIHSYNSNEGFPHMPNIEGTLQSFTAPYIGGLDIYAATGDDFSYGFLVGTPPLAQLASFV
jgi:hypothetical protein